ncbi:MAG: transposase [Candidatus Omnitrophica bacterium]|nr:transposase [Candidatus Omnitrophota bacterium]
MNKFKNIYRIASTRLKNWNYASAGYYFVTICAYNRVNCFGDIIDGGMCLSDIGYVANKNWLKIPEHFPNVILDEYVIMPNHIHGIIVINNKKNDNIPVDNNIMVETQNFASLQKTSKQLFNKFAPQSKNLASIIRGYKVSVKKWTTINNIDFKWQPRFYDHVVREDESLENIRRYVVNNPINWQDDQENKGA